MDRKPKAESRKANTSTKCLINQNPTASVVISDGLKPALLLVCNNKKNFSLPRDVASDPLNNAEQLLLQKGVSRSVLRRERKLCNANSSRTAKNDPIQVSLYKNVLVERMYLAPARKCVGNASQGWGAWNMPAAAETDSPSGPPTFYPASQTLPALRDLPVLPSSSVASFLEADIVEKELEVLDSLVSDAMDSLVEKVMNVTNIRCGDYLEHKLTKCLGPKTYQRIATSKSAFSEEILPQCEEQTTNNLTSENVSLPKVVPTDPFPSLDFEPSADLIAEADKAIGYHLKRLQLLEGPKERARHENDDPDWDLIEEVLNENVTLTEVVTTSMFSTLDFETTANLAAEADIGITDYLKRLQLKEGPEKKTCRGNARREFVSRENDEPHWDLIEEIINDDLLRNASASACHSCNAGQNTKFGVPNGSVLSPIPNAPRQLSQPTIAGASRRTQDTNSQRVKLKNTIPESEKQKFNRCFLRVAMPPPAKAQPINHQAVLTPFKSSSVKVVDMLPPRHNEMASNEKSTTKLTKTDIPPCSERTDTFQRPKYKIVSKHERKSQSSKSLNLFQTQNQKSINEHCSEDFLEAVREDPVKRKRQPEIVSEIRKRDFQKLSTSVNKENSGKTNCQLLAQQTTPNVANVVDRSSSNVELNQNTFKQARHCDTLRNSALKINKSDSEDELVGKMIEAVSNLTQISDASVSSEMISGLKVTKVREYEEFCRKLKSDINEVIKDSKVLTINTAHECRTEAKKENFQKADICHEVSEPDFHIVISHEESLQNSDQEKVPYEKIDAQPKEVLINAKGTSKDNLSSSEPKTPKKPSEMSLLDFHKKSADLNKENIDANNTNNETTVRNSWGPGSKTLRILSQKIGEISIPIIHLRPPTSLQCSKKKEISQKDEEIANKTESNKGNFHVNKLAKDNKADNHGWDENDKKSNEVVMVSNLQEFRPATNLALKESVPNLPKGNKGIRKATALENILSPKDIILKNLPADLNFLSQHNIIIRKTPSFHNVDHQKGEKVLIKKKYPSKDNLSEPQADFWKKVKLQANTSVEEHVALQSSFGQDDEDLPESLPVINKNAIFEADDLAKPHSTADQLRKIKKTLRRKRLSNKTWIRKRNRHSLLNWERNDLMKKISMQIKSLRNLVRSNEVPPHRIVNKKLLLISESLSRFSRLGNVQFLKTRRSGRRDLVSSKTEIKPSGLEDFKTSESHSQLLVGDPQESFTSSEQLPRNQTRYFLRERKNFPEYRLD